MTIKFLITGFEPFDNEPMNAAWEVVSEFSRTQISLASVAIAQLPTVFDESIQVLKQTIQEVQPDVVLCVGQAGGRSAMSFEWLGVNLDDARIADNKGNQPVLHRNVPDGPDAYFSSLPVRQLVEAVRGVGIPAEESMSAGTYVCNHVLYGLMHHLKVSGLGENGVIGGFIHIPFLPEQAARNKNAPCLSLDVMVQGLTAVVNELVRHKNLSR